MRIRLLSALLLLPVCVHAQNPFTVSGQIVNEAGNPVEYVQVGIPKSGVGTVSSLDGRFEGLFYRIAFKAKSGLPAPAVSEFEIILK